MIIIDEKFHVVITDPESHPQFFDLSKEQQEILKSWFHSKADKVKKPNPQPRRTMYAHLTRSDPKSWFAQYIDCTLSSKEGCTPGLQLSAYDPTFTPSMFDLVPEYGVPYVYEVQAIDVKPYQDTSGMIRYDIYHITLVDVPYGLRFTKVLGAGDAPDLDNDEDLV